MVECGGAEGERRSDCEGTRVEPTDVGVVRIEIAEIGGGPDRLTGGVGLGGG